jgi:hypothetical protein
MASRMESHGTPETIQITRTTFELLRNDFVIEPIGLVDMNGKGEVETWRLLGPSEGPADGGVSHVAGDLAAKRLSWRPGRHPESARRTSRREPS